MEFRIADTFTDSLTKLTGQEQKIVKTTAFDLQMNPANPSMQFHRIDRSKDPNFWSIRVNRDIRLVIHKTKSSMLLCYVDHHDQAYQWAERRRLEKHPKTGAAQLVEVRETIKEIIIPQYVEEVQTKQLPLLFEDVADEELLSYGVPADWVADVQKVTEDTLFHLTPHLPQEAAEALLDLATGATPRAVYQALPEDDPFEHPEAQRRFRVMKDTDELKRALDYPWEKWTLFLHPEQRTLVNRDYNGPVRIAGSAGTGKTVVALHRAVHLARTYPGNRVLLTTFSAALANALRTKLIRLVEHEPRLAERIEVYAMNEIGRRLYELRIGSLQLVDQEKVRQLLEDANQREYDFTTRFLMMEWEQVVDAWQLQSWEEYRDVRRLGRKTRLAEGKRQALWTIFEQVRARLKEQNVLTEAEMFFRLADHLVDTTQPVFDFVVVDEAQDVSVSELRFLAALSQNRPNGLLLAGDLGQRIFQPPFSWKALGVDIKGRSYTLRINYRTSHQIKAHADRLLDTTITDVDGHTIARNDSISVFNGPPPNVRVLDTEEEEGRAVSEWLSDHCKQGCLPHEIGVFVRSTAELPRGQAALEAAGIPFKVLDDRVQTTHGYASLTTMHLAKGLEFKMVVVMACDDEIIPQQERIETISDEADLEEVYNTERHLLYVACTRARDALLVTSVDPASEFLDDLKIA
jgi:mRNA-degrading endonuclease RelE of RelBE toxin-antitoxin system